MQTEKDEGAVTACDFCASVGVPLTLMEYPIMVDGVLCRELCAGCHARYANNNTAAGHRTIIKRAMRRMMIPVDVNVETSALNEWARANPEAVAPILEGWFKRAALAWERGNNSGNSDAYQLACGEQDRLHRQAESVLRLFNVTCSYPGLYPLFHTPAGMQDHTMLRAMRESSGQ